MTENTSQSTKSSTEPQTKPAEQLLFFGIDQSFTSTGLCIIDQMGNLIYHGTIHTDPKEDGNRFIRASKIANEIVDVIEKYKPFYISIEGLAFGARGNAARDLAGLQFAIMSTAHERVPQLAKRIEIVSPKHLKLHATGIGTASKELMCKALPVDVKKTIARTYPKTKGRSDVTDAYWLARYGLRKR